VLSRDDLLAMYERCGVSDQARAVIDHIRCSDPAHRVRSGRGNVRGRYPSKKMGVTIQFESHRVEPTRWSMTRRCWNYVPPKFMLGRRQTHPGNSLHSSPSNT
jgi:hypothetical protein